MTSLANATPAPGTSPTMPTPAAAAPPPAEAVPAPAAVVEPAAPATPAQMAEAPAALSTSSVDAGAAASAANQAAAAQAIEEAAPEPEVAAAAPAPVGDFTTGNKAFDQVATLLADKQVPGFSDILTEAASGEVSLASKAALAETLGGPVAELVLSQLEGEMTAVRTAGEAEGTRLKVKAAEAFGYSADRADETWEALKNFARTEESGLSPSDLDVLTEMFAKGGVQGDMAINDIVSRYEKSKDFTRVPSLMAGDGKMQSGFQPLTKQAYQAQIREAVKVHGEQSREVAALRSQRTTSIQRGY